MIENAGKHLIEGTLHSLVLLYLAIGESGLAFTLYLVFIPINAVLGNAIMDEYLLRDRSTISSMIHRMPYSLGLIFRTAFDLIGFVASVMAVYIVVSAAEIVEKQSEKGLDSLKSIPDDPILGFDQEAIGAAIERNLSIIEVSENLSTFPFGMSMLEFLIAFYLISRAVYLIFWLIKARGK